MAKKLPNFEPEARYRVTFSSVAEYGDARFVPGKGLVILKGKVANAVKEAIAEAEKLAA